MQFHILKTLRPLFGLRTRHLDLQALRMEHPRRRSASISLFHSSRASESEYSAQERNEAGPYEDHGGPITRHYAFAPPPPLTDDSRRRVNDLFNKILWLDMIEVHLLTQIVHEQMGLKWSDVESATSSVRGGAAPSAVVGEFPEEKALNDVKLVGFDVKSKIKVIKEVRSVVGLGLKEAKEMVESSPKVIQKDLKPEKAEELKAQLEAVGAHVEII